MHRIYIASALSNKNKVDQLFSVIEAHHPVEFTYKWYEVGKVPKDAYLDVASKELHGVLNADVFIALLPGKKGTHTELGIAIATCPKVIVLGEEDDFEPVDEDNYPSIFYFLPMVERVVYDGTREGLFKTGLKAFEQAIRR
jgi:nucleoside 2-deoxyribosyltransferase